MLAIFSFLNIYKDGKFAAVRVLLSFDLSIIMAELEAVLWNSLLACNL
jgi:hypothetical protein